MEELRKAVQLTPIIDHHAHNLLLSSQLQAHSLLSITTEANGAALEHTSSTLAHLRAVRQLANILECEHSWDAVKANLDEKRRLGDDSWVKYCFHGIETVLIDDGLDADTVHPYHWHHSLTRSKCKRVLRIEKVAETILLALFREYRESPGDHQHLAQSRFTSDFLRIYRNELEDAIQDSEVVGFKSVICYRTGLAIPHSVDPEVAKNSLSAMLNDPKPQKRFQRIADDILSPFLVHLTAELLTRNQCRKPFQFHTGLGDSDIRLQLSSPSYLQPFIEKFPTIPIVLLHASYPYTKEAGYLASTYHNVYLDIGEVFPMVSQEGQEHVIREALELCPSEKLTWSTDGHWYPETFLLATIQVRQGLEKVLCEYVESQALTVSSAIKIVHDVLFLTSNRLYGLELTLTPMDNSGIINRNVTSRVTDLKPLKDFGILKDLLARNPSIKYLRLQWLDYTATARLKILPIQRALSMFEEASNVGVTKCVLGLLQGDVISPGFKATGMYDLYPAFESLRIGERAGYAMVQCEIRDQGKHVAACPRTSLRTILDRGGSHNLSFLVGFEIEVVFMSWSTEDNANKYGAFQVTQGHCWSSSRALHSEKFMDLVESIMARLSLSGIEIQELHAESAPGQFEFIMSPLEALKAVDTLLAAREIITSLAAKHSLHATFLPKPYPKAPGTGAHVHFSMTPPEKHQSFLAGILKHLPAIAAFTYSNDVSYERVMDTGWSGGTWIGWGTQNRETPLRRIEQSHYEFRCMDGLANPYLALSAVIGAGIQGVLDSEPLTMKDCLEDPAKLSDDDRRSLGIVRQLPRSFNEAMSSLEEDAQLRSILGDPLCNTYTVVKREESNMLAKMKPDDRRSWLLERY